MILFDLYCLSHHHRFEGWFGSAADYDLQKDKGLLCCPVCGGADVAKSVSAPRLTRKSNQMEQPSHRVSPAPVAGQEDSHAIAMPAPEEIPAQLREALHKVAEAQAEMLKQSQWVGKAFVEEARAIHYGEKEARLIHGQTTREEAEALQEEGVPIAPLLVPVIPPEAKN